MTTSVIRMARNHVLQEAVTALAIVSLVVAAIWL